MVNMTRNRLISDPALDSHWPTLSLAFQNQYKQFFIFFTHSDTCRFLLIDVDGPSSAKTTVVSCRSSFSMNYANIQKRDIDKRERQMDLLDCLVN